MGPNNGFGVYLYWSIAFVFKLFQISLYLTNLSFFWQTDRPTDRPRNPIYEAPSRSLKRCFAYWWKRTPSVWKYTHFSLFSSWPLKPFCTKWAIGVVFGFKCFIWTYIYKQSKVQSYLFKLWFGSILGLLPFLALMGNF